MGASACLNLHGPNIALLLCRKESDSQGLQQMCTRSIRLTSWLRRLIAFLGFEEACVAVVSSAGLWSLTEAWGNTGHCSGVQRPHSLHAATDRAQAALNVVTIERTRRANGGSVVLAPAVPNAVDGKRKRPMAPQEPCPYCAHTYTVRDGLSGKLNPNGER